MVEIIPALELVAEAGDGAAAHGGVLVGGVGGAAVGLAVADPALRDALAALLAAEVALPVIIPHIRASLLEFVRSSPVPRWPRPAAGLGGD